MDKKRNINHFWNNLDDYNLASLFSLFNFTLIFNKILENSNLLLHKLNHKHSFNRNVNTSKSNLIGYEEI